MTQHSPRLFELTTSNDPSIRYAAVDLIGHLLRQGLINPMETVPHLLALQGDVGAPDVRLLVRKLLIIEGEKRPDMLRQRVCAGVRQAYLFQRIVYSNNKHMTAVVKEESILIDKSVKKENVCIFGPIFEDSIKSSRVQRQGLIKSLLTLFTNDRQKYDYENIPYPSSLLCRDDMLCCDDNNTSLCCDNTSNKICCDDTVTSLCCDYTCINTHCENTHPSICCDNITLSKSCDNFNMKLCCDNRVTLKIQNKLDVCLLNMYNPWNVQIFMSNTSFACHFSDYLCRVHFPK